MKERLWQVCTDFQHKSASFREALSVIINAGETTPLDSATRFAGLDRRERLVFNATASSQRPTTAQCYGCPWQRSAAHFLLAPHASRVCTPTLAN